MKIGHGKAKITPPLGVELSGYGYFLKRRNKGVLEDLYARAVVIEFQGERALLFEADLIGLTPELSSALDLSMLVTLLRRPCASRKAWRATRSTSNSL